MAIRLPIRRNSRTVRPSYIRNWRLYGSKQKSAGESHTLDRLSHEAWFKCTDVGGDIRQFWLTIRLRNSNERTLDRIDTNFLSLAWRQALCWRNPCFCQVFGRRDWSMMTDNAIALVSVPCYELPTLWWRHPDSC
jgi:hypothetical protein